MKTNTLVQLDLEEIAMNLSVHEALYLVESLDEQQMSDEFTEAAVMKLINGLSQVYGKRDMKLFISKIKTVVKEHYK